MSGYKTHLIFYLGILSITSLIIDVEPMLLFSGGLVGALYCILPDADSTGSFLGNKIMKSLIFLFTASITGWVLLAELFYLMLAVFTALILSMQYFARHRGFMHSIPCAFLLCLPPMLIREELLLFALTGYLSHLLLDSIPGLRSKKGFLFL